MENVTDLGGHEYALGKEGHQYVCQNVERLQETTHVTHEVEQSVDAALKQTHSIVEPELGLVVG